MRCPWCGSAHVLQTLKFDHSSIGKDECVHDFECAECEGLFTITYAAVDVTRVTLDT